MQTLISIHELLEDEKYRKYFLTRPTMPRAPRISPPWRLYVQLDTGQSWRKKDFWDYAEAVKYFAQLRKRGLHDAAITCRPMAWTPPSKIVRVKGKFHKNSKGEMVPVTREVFWRPQMPADEEAHLWCPYCRRPTVFKAFARHHALSGEYGKMMDPGAARCTICGIRQEGLGEWARQRGY